VHCSVENVAVLCKNYHESHRFELAHLKKKKKKKKKMKKKKKKKMKKKKKKERKKEKTFGCLVTFWFGTFVMPFSATGCVFCHENTQR